MATHSSILAWRIPWTEEPDGPQSIGSQKVRHNLATKQSTAQRYVFISGLSNLFDYSMFILMLRPHFFD